MKSSEYVETQTTVANGLLWRFSEWFILSSLQAPQDILSSCMLILLYVKFLQLSLSYLAAL